MNTAYLHLGSNEGNRIEMLEKAISQIKEKIGKVAVQSSYYETEAWGMKDQANFINMALEVKTELPAKQLMKVCKNIELELGGVKKEKWGPRTIDIDLLFLNDEIIESSELNLPHPQIENRNFVLIPLMEIAGEYVHPKLNKTIEEIFDDCEDECEVFIYEG